MTHTDIAMRSAFLARLPAHVADSLLKEAERKHLGRDQVLFWEGEHPEGVAIVLEGQLKLSTTDADGTEAVLGFFGPGESLGEGPVFSASPYPADVTAIQPTHLVLLPRPLLERHVHTNPRALIGAIGANHHQVMQLVRQLRDLKTLRSSERLASFLLARTAGGPAQAVALTYDKAILAGYLGIAPETLSRSFRELAAHGVRVSGRAIAIDDPDALEAFRYRRS